MYCGCIKYINTLNCRLLAGHGPAPHGFLAGSRLDGVAAAGHDRLCGCFGATHRGDARDAICHCVFADRLFVGEGVRAAGCRVDNQIERAGFEKIDGVWAAFIYFENGFRLAPAARMAAAVLGLR